MELKKDRLIDWLTLKSWIANVSVSLKLEVGEMERFQRRRKLKQNWILLRKI